MRARTPTSALACLAIAASTPALGGPILFTWDGNNDGNYNGFYSEALDWNPNGVPNGYVEARWDATPNSYTVIFTSDRTVEIATVIDPQLTLISNAGGPQYTFHATDFRVGEFPTYAHSVKVFELEIDIANELLLEYGGDMFLGGTAGPNGDMVCETLTLNGPSSCILSANGSTSSATVNGSAFVRNFSTLSATNDGDVTVGDTLDLEGTLSVNSGGTATIGTLNAKVDTPTISVSGSGSQLRAVKADFDDATVNVLDSGALVLLAGPGQHWIKQGTSLTVDTGGLFYVYGDLRLDTPLDLLANATLYVDDGVEVCLNSPGRINHSATLTQALPAVYDVNSNTTIDVATDLRFGGGSTMLVGGNVEVGRYFDIATVGVVGATGVYFFGSTASLMVNATGQSWWGRSGHSAEIEFNFGATANVPGGVELAHSVNDGTTGFIDVTVGSVLTLGTLEIAALGGATTWGQAAVTGNNSEIIQTGAASLIVGHSSTGTANVYILDNGKFTTGTGQTVIHPTGRITLDNGTLDVNGSFTCNGQLTGTGTVIIGGTVVNGGLCGPGGSPGILTIDGSYQQTAAGTLDLEIGGPIVGTDYDQLNVTGTATLAGTVNVTLIDGFVPEPGQSFEILTAGSVVGQFDTVNLPPDLELDFSGGTVTVVGPLCCDLDGDGIIGITDFLMLLAAWGPCGDCGNCQADFDGDCQVGIQDFLTLLANWG